MITYILRMMVLILGTIVQESHTALPIYPHSSYILDPMPSLKGSGFKKGVYEVVLSPQEPLFGGCSWHWLLSEGSGLPLLMLCPPCHLTVSFPWSLYKRAIVDEMFQAATVVAVFLICLGVLYNPCQAYHNLFHNSFNSAGIVTLLIFIIVGVLFF